MMNQEHPCLNCGHPITQTDKFCPQCGQGTDEHLMTFKELVSHFFNSFTNLDNSAFQTVKYIARPWKLTQFYVEGKKKSFLNPIRVFLILMLFHFGLIFSSINFGKFSFENELSQKAELHKMYTNYKEIEKAYIGQCDSMKMMIDTTLFSSYDTLNKDTLFPISTPTRSYRISAHDILEMDQDSINKKYHFTKFTEKLFAKQIIKSAKDLSSTLQYMLGNFMWVIILSILTLAGFFKLIYYKSKKTYVEHLVFLLNVHSFAFLVNTILFYINSSFFDLDWKYYILFFFIPSTIFFISLYKYYQQRKFITFLKSTMSCFVYTMTNLIFMVLTIILSFLIF